MQGATMDTETKVEEQVAAPETAIAELPEAEKIKQLNSELASQPSEIQAIIFLKGAIPKFTSELVGLSATETKQVLRALIQSPLEELGFEFESKKATRLFNLGTMIANAKFMLFSVATIDAISKIIKETHDVDIAPRELRNLVNECLGEPLEPIPEVKASEGENVTSETTTEEVEEREYNGN